jgi:hypothetical protein
MTIERYFTSCQYFSPFWGYWPVKGFWLVTHHNYALFINWNVLTTLQYEYKYFRRFTFRTNRSLINFHGILFVCSSVVLYSVRHNNNNYYYISSAVPVSMNYWSTTDSTSTVSTARVLSYYVVQQLVPSIAIDS